ncbi:DUF6457 domain-containing protein [Streptomyces xinghaiensis]|uniref:DUF6457 domain-containing protein n=1 Tax=Streptomyces xinghaiensis TaxID=1038928 RepID=UPI000BAF9462|nr:DUF6457 domain-containing protein [Streptomyces xinghaiensis]
MTVLVYDAVVLAGGAAKRLGGADKPGLRVGGRPLLDRVLDACPDAAGTVVVGSRRPTVRPVRWTFEQPPGGGPLAALDAGVRHVTAPVVLALSADLPFLTADTVRALLTALDAPYTEAGADAGTGTGAGAGIAAAAETGPDREAAAPQPYARARRPESPYLPAGPARPDGVLLTDADGRDQPLVAVYRTEPLRRELALIAAEHGGLAHLPLRLLTADLSLRRLPAPDPAAAFDCDTWDHLAAARARIRDHGRVLDEWISEVKKELGIELDVDTAALLDLARDAAHGVARPAAPLTTFLVGYAAGRSGGGPEQVLANVRRAEALAARWAEEAGEDPGKNTE